MQKYCGNSSSQVHLWYSQAGLKSWNIDRTVRQYDSELTWTFIWKESEVIDGEPSVAGGALDVQSEVSVGVHGDLASVPLGPRRVEPGGRQIPDLEHDSTSNMNIHFCEHMFSVNHK